MGDLDPWCAWFDDDGRRHRRPPPRMIEDPALGACLRYAGGAIVIALDPPVMTWVPDATSWPALNAASNCISQELRPPRVRLRYYVSGWAEEDLPPAEIFTRLDYIDRIARHSIDLAPRVQPLPASADEEARAAEIAAKVHRNHLDDLILYDVSETGDLRYGHIGARTLFARLFTPEEVRGVMGQDVSFGPGDNGFADAITAAYRMALEGNRTIVDLVTAPVRLGGREPRWLHYKRITVPLPSYGKLAVFADPAPPQRISFD